jgi:hypothetical protein
MPDEAPGDEGDVPGAGVVATAGLVDMLALLLKAGTSVAFL